MVARRAVHADEASSELATVQEGPELALDESRQLAAGLPRPVEKRLEVAVLYYKEGYDDSGYERYDEIISELSRTPRNSWR